MFNDWIRVFGDLTVNINWIKTIRLLDFGFEEDFLNFYSVQEFESGPGL